MSATPPAVAPLTRPAPGILKWRHVLAAVVALALAPAVWAARNLASDHVFYGRTQERRTVQAYEAYVAQGWLHVKEATRELHRLAFEEAKRAATATALRRYLQRYPQSPYRDDARRELHAAYQRALERFRAQAARSDPRLIAFIEALLRHLETAGASGFVMRFDAPSIEALERVDRNLGTLTAGIEGTPVPISEHFRSSSVLGHERIVGQLQKGFEAVFPADILTLTRASSGLGADQPLLQVQYEVRPSGSVYVSKQDEQLGQKRLFVGILVAFRVRMEIPDGSRPLEFRFDVAPPESFQVRYTTTTRVVASRSDPRQVYAVMAERAFDELASKLRATFFDPSSEAFRRATDS